MKLFGKMFPREEDEEFRDLSDKPEMEAALREAMKPAEEQDLVMKIEGLERRNTSKLPPLKLAEESPAAQAAPEAPEELDPLQKSVHEMLNKKYAEATKAAADAAETVQEALPDREELPALELSAEAADSLEEAVPELPALELSEAEDFAAEAAEPELPALELPEIEAEEPAAEQELPELEAETPEQAEPEQELPEAEASEPAAEAPDLELPAEEVSVLEASRSTMPKLRLDIPVSEEQKVAEEAEPAPAEGDKKVAAVTYASMAEAMKQSTQSIPTSPTRKSRSAVDDETLLAEIYALMGDTPPKSAAAKQPPRAPKPAAPKPEEGTDQEASPLRISANLNQDRSEEAPIQPQPLDQGRQAPEEDEDDEIPVRVEEQGAPGWLKGVFLLLISAVLSGMTMYAVAADVLGKFF